MHPLVDVELMFGVRKRNAGLLGNSLNIYLVVLVSWNFRGLRHCQQLCQLLGSFQQGIP